ncbi:MAG: DUF3298 domain-containing protein [Paludibacteraceae bacterium]|nr:DUF3298 domain-containing protein [Paludibacteraceae bacterium]
MKKILFILLVITLVGCSSEKDDLFETKSYSCEIVNKELNLQFEFTGEIELPTTKMGDSHKLLQESIISALFGSEFADYSTKKVLRVYADSSFVEYEKVYEEIYDHAECTIDNAQICNFETHVKGWVLYCDSNILSYQRELYTYAGGAHGMNTKTNYVFDIKTGKRLTEEDIFGQGFERKIGKLLDEKANTLRSKSILPTEDEFYNDWYIEPNGNFALTDSSIIYTFNPYEIAPYCFGIIDIEIAKN